ncbi:SDR family oxidoreductase [Cellulomonas fengjieae]|uniref:SDR family oxidoreductase n=1 Tax=Cellulomonas fengjieae TaxID=2819978 RepID=A0ABS3SHM9_9CELL|nr:SDR family oxidoreductase [Cellulomonas fengjieae]MBO3085253.1 SDR family oxidoreductase [Cellulomonas fengjieae]QVI66183.1 SDR family oxidoreductase [Cellulomonas fengjieae]
MSVVVTGASGHLGRLVVQHLLAGGMPADQVVAGGRRTERLEDLGTRTATVDYDDPASLETAFAGAETVLLVSGSEVGQRVAQHGRVIDAAKAAGVRRVVYTSAPHADTTGLVLAPEHKATEELLRASGLAWTVLRNNWYTENYVGTLHQARSTGVILTSAGDGRVASATRDDFAAGAAAVLLGGEHDGRVYELSGDVAWSFDDLAEAASTVLGVPVVAKRVSSEEHRAILVGAGLDEGTAGFVAALDADIARGDLADATSDLRTLIGRPTTPLVDGLRAALAES